MSLPTLDWILLAVMLLSMLLGLWRGLVFEVISLASWVVAFFLAQWLAPDVAQVLPMAGATEPIRYAAGFVAVFVGCLVAGGIIAFVIKKLLAAVGLGFLDRLLGGAFGLLRGLVVVLAVAVVVQMTPLDSAAFWKASQGARWAETALAALKPLMPQEFGKYLSS